MIAFLFMMSTLAYGQATHLDTLRHLDVRPAGDYSAIWGYTAPDGREYAILGTTTPGGTSIIDITDINNVHEVAFISGLNSDWREMKTYGHYAYVVSEASGASGGTQIIDLSGLPDTAWLVTTFVYTSGTKNTRRAHSISIHDGFMYLNGCANWGTTTAQRGTVIFDLRTTPTSPQYVGEYSPNYFHDVYVLRDTIYGSSIYSGGGLYIADAKNKASIQPIGKISYSGSGTHNAWVTKDRQYVITTDEIGTSGYTLKSWPIGNLPTIPTSASATYTSSPGEIEHNITIRGDYAYVAWYTAGVRVVNVANPAAPVNAGGYDTSTLTSGYHGAWGVYPYFPSGKIIADDIENGLWIFSFSDLAPRIPVDLLSPLNASAVTCPGPANFRWTRTANSSKDPHTYVLRVNGPGVNINMETADTSYTISNFTNFQSGQNYQWSVMVKDEFNNTASQDTFSFQYNQGTPAAPSLISPANAALDQPLSLNVSWSSADCASSYRLQVSSDSLFTSLVVDDSTLTGNSKLIGPLAHATEYFWRVNAQNSTGPGGFSAANSFTTVIAPPAAPALLLPVDLATDEPVNLDLVWNPSPTAASYHLQMATDSLFASLVLNDSTLTDTTRTASSLSHLTRYFWRVRAKNSGGWSPFAAYNSFTTIIAPPAVPSLAQPFDNASGLAIIVVLQWNPAAAAQSYRVQAATDSMFSSLILDDSTVTGTSRQTDSLDIGRVYYWRVRAENTSGESGWSSVWKFTTTFAVNRQYQVAGGWNLLSVPLTVSDFSKKALFPESVSDAFAFVPTTGYVQQNILQNNAGYWLKYGSASGVDIEGDIRRTDTIQVEAGWNLIGSLSESFPSDSVVSVPSGIVLTDFFGYNSGYSSADTLMPFAGYWVKVSEAGILILSGIKNSPTTTLAPAKQIQKQKATPASPRSVR